MDGSGQDPSKDFTAAAMTLFSQGFGAIARQPLIMLGLFVPALKPLLALVSDALASRGLLPGPLQVMSDDGCPSVVVSAATTSVIIINLFRHHPSQHQKTARFRFRVI